MDADVVAPELAAAATTADEERRAAALAAATGVADHAAKVGKAISWIGVGTAVVGPGIWGTPWGLAVGAAALAGILAMIWQVQDHLDSKEPFALPDVTDGMRQKVAAALQA